MNTSSRKPPCTNISRADLKHPGTHRVDLVGSHTGSNVRSASWCAASEIHCRDTIGQRIVYATTRTVVSNRLGCVVSLRHSHGRTLAGYSRVLASKVAIENKSSLARATVRYTQDGSCLDTRYNRLSRVCAKESLLSMPVSTGESYSTLSCKSFQCTGDLVEAARRVVLSTMGFSNDGATRLCN